MPHQIGAEFVCRRQRTEHCKITGTSPLVLSRRSRRYSCSLARAPAFTDTGSKSSQSFGLWAGVEMIFATPPRRFPSSPPRHRNLQRCTCRCSSFLKYLHRTFYKNRRSAPHFYRIQINKRQVGPQRIRNRIDSVPADSGGNSFHFSHHGDFLFHISSKGTGQFI